MFPKCRKVEINSGLAGLKRKKKKNFPSYIWATFSNRYMDIGLLKSKQTGNKPYFVSSIHLPFKGVSGCDTQKE